MEFLSERDPSKRNPNMFARDMAQRGKNIQKQMNPGCRQRTMVYLAYCQYWSFLLSLSPLTTSGCLWSKLAVLENSTLVQVLAIPYPPKVFSPPPINSLSYVFQESMKLNLIYVFLWLNTVSKDLRVMTVSRCFRSNGVRKLLFYLRVVGIFASYVNVRILLASISFEIYLLLESLTCYLLLKLISIQFLIVSTNGSGMRWMKMESFRTAIMGQSERLEFSSSTWLRRSRAQMGTMISILFWVSAKRMLLVSLRCIRMDYLLLLFKINY